MASDWEGEVGDWQQSNTAVVQWLHDNNMGTLQCYSWEVPTGPYRGGPLQHNPNLRMVPHPVKQIT